MGRATRRHAPARTDRRRRQDDRGCPPAHCRGIARGRSAVDGRFGYRAVVSCLGPRAAPGNSFAWSGGNVANGSASLVDQRSARLFPLACERRLRARLESGFRHDRGGRPRRSYPAGRRPQHRPCSTRSPPCSDCRRARLRPRFARCDAGQGERGRNGASDCLGRTCCGAEANLCDAPPRCRRRVRTRR